MKPKTETVIINNKVYHLKQPIYKSRAVKIEAVGAAIVAANDRQAPQRECATEVGLTVPGLRLQLALLGIKWNNLRDFTRHAE
jgi:hypothetical protein